MIISRVTVIKVIYRNNFFYQLVYIHFRKLDYLNYLIFIQLYIISRVTVIKVIHILNCLIFIQ